MPNTRIKGKAAIFKLATTDYAADITTITLNNEDADSDVTTFADAAAGGAIDWFFEGTAIQSTDTAALWKYLWTNSGTTSVAYVFAPHGNATPSTTKPHYTGTVDIGPKPAIGGDADSTFTFEFRLDCNEEPTQLTA